MTSFIVPAGAGEDAVFDDARLHPAAADHLARFKGLSREHADSDLRAFFSWCAGRHIDPLRAQRAELDLYVRWMQETRRFKPSTVPGVPQCSAASTAPPSSTASWHTAPAEYVRRPTVPPESPTLGLTHLQFEAMLTAATGDLRLPIARLRQVFRP